MKNLLLAVCLLLVLSGCSQLSADVKDSTQSLKKDFNDTKDRLVEGIDETKEFVDDVSTAAKKIKEAKEAISEISK